jgi:hypothetical protein
VPVIVNAFTPRPLKLTTSAPSPINNTIAQRNALCAGSEAARRVTNAARQKARMSAISSRVTLKQMRRLMDDAAKNAAKRASKAARDAAEQAAKTAGMTSEKVKAVGDKAAGLAGTAANAGGADGAADDAARKAARSVIKRARRQAARDAKTSGLTAVQTAQWIAAAVRNAAPEAKRAANAERARVLHNFHLCTTSTGSSVGSIGSAPVKNGCACTCSRLCACCKSAPLPVIRVKGGVWVPATEGDAVKNRMVANPVIPVPGGIWVPASQAQYWTNGFPAPSVFTPCSTGQHCQPAPPPVPCTGLCKQTDPHMLGSDQSDSFTRLYGEDASTKTSG